MRLLARAAPPTLTHNGGLSTTLSSAHADKARRNEHVAPLLVCHVSHVTAQLGGGHMLAANSSPLDAAILTSLLWLAKLSVYFPLSTALLQL